MGRLLSAIALLVLGSSNPASAQSLVGKWLGQSSTQEHVRCWLNHRRADGTYDITFLQISSSAPRRHFEEGLWLHSNGLYATITQRINGQATDSRDKGFREFYRVVQLDNERFIYSDLATGGQFQVTRVPDSFVLGDKCPSGT